MLHIEQFVIKKRNELIQHLYTVEGYTGAQLSRMFNLNRSTITRIIKKK